MSRSLVVVAALVLLPFSTFACAKHAQRTVVGAKKTTSRAEAKPQPAATSEQRDSEVSAPKASTHIESTSDAAENKKPTQRAKPNAKSLAAPKAAESKNQ